MSRKFRIVAECGNIDIDCPPDFDFTASVRMIRGDGYAMGPTFYIPVQRIVAMFVFDPETPPPFTPRDSKETLQ